MSAEWVYDMVEKNKYLPTVEKNKYPWAITSSPMNRFSYLKSGRQCFFLAFSQGPMKVRWET